jgi:hypothetical protein
VAGRVQEGRVSTSGSARVLLKAGSVGASRGDALVFVVPVLAGERVVQPTRVRWKPLRCSNRAEWAYSRTAGAIGPAAFPPDVAEPIFRNLLRDYV